jgi:16S rRNA (cytidine1402-2'-O)-methyltransferase
MKESGMLLLVATPIGNLKDISFRAIEELKNADIIAAEDTRHSGKLLKAYGINTKMISLHKFNEAQKRDYLLELLHGGNTVALISDAGTPGICDPGEDIVSACIRENIAVSIVPGANALISALAISGISSSSFTFHGFMPKRKKEKEELLISITGSSYTNIFYESPHRIKATLEMIDTLMPKRKVALVRELTKLHEETLQDSAQNLLQVYTTKEPKGEYVLIIEGDTEEIKKDVHIDLEHAAELVNEYMKKGEKKNDAIKKVCSQTNLDRKTLYNRLKND